MRHDPQLLQALLAPSRRTGRRPRLSLLTALFNLADGKAELLRHSEQSWASATFAGTRHAVTLAFNGASAVTAAEAMIAALPDHEFDLPGQIVADAAVKSVDQAMLPEPRLVLELELLLLEDS